MDEEIKKLLEQNLEYSKEIYRMTRKIKNHVTFQKIMSLIYLLLIVAPIILGIFFLPPLLKGIYEQYKDILGAEPGASESFQELIKGSASLNLDGLDINKAKELLNKLK